MYDLTKQFTNELLEIFQTRFSDLPSSKHLSEDGDALFTEYQAVQLLQDTLETIIKENKYVVKKDYSSYIGKWAAFRQEGMKKEILHGKVIRVDDFGVLTIKCKNSVLRYKSIGDVIDFFDTRKECYSIKTPYTCLTDEEMTIISDRISNQDGRKYPCSNQVIVCGFFSTDEDWNNFIESNETRIIKQKRDSVYLENGESWLHFNIHNFPFRGYRFYKIKIDKTIDRDVFFTCIYPYCSLYCKEIEWL